MPVIYDREKVNYLNKNDVNIVLKNGGAIYTPNVYKRGGAIFKSGSKSRDGYQIEDEIYGGTFMSGLQSVGNWISNNKSTIEGVSSAVGNVASTVTGIVKGATEVENMKKRNDAEIEMIRERNKAEIEAIRNRGKKKDKIDLDDIEGGKFNNDDLKTKIKTKNTFQSDMVVNKILRTKRDIIDGEGFKLITQ
jgi:hypothetical protein